jgi:tetratricopeptide (TPR) repeat protein
MLTDRYDLPVSTGSAAARDAYVRALDRLLMLHDGVLDAFDAAVAADPGFALAHAGRAQVLLMFADAPGARAALDRAEALLPGATAREASQIRFFRTMMSAPVATTLAALEAHLARWPRDAIVLNTTANPNGLHGSSGERGQKARLAALMTALAPHYGEDWWFGSSYGMALNEDGQREAARRCIARSYAQQPASGWIAHSRAHLFYEDGDPGAARAFLAEWLKTYPRGGILHGHLHWHLALGALAEGDLAEAARLYREAFSLAGHSGLPRQKLQDAVSFLWRMELAGAPRDAAAWREMHDFAVSHFPRAAASFPDLHVVLAQSVAGDGAGLEARIRQMEDLARAGRYPSGSVIPAASRGFTAFARGDFDATIAALEPLLAESERIGGSRAQTDLVEFTLLKACVAAGRFGDLRRLVGARRPGPAGVPVAGVH